MQSQQKRLKWSRGETAEALEERTDTGITQASVELMENCIPDVYGNISRRPALKLIKQDQFARYAYVWDTPTKVDELGNHGWAALSYFEPDVDQGTKKYFALSSTGFVSWSEDGVIWDSATGSLLNAGWSDCVSSTQLNPGTGHRYFMISHQGYIAWAGWSSLLGYNVSASVQDSHLGNNYWNGLARGDNNFVAIGRDGYVSTAPILSNSLPGTFSDAEQNTTLGARGWKSITYGDGRFVAITTSGYTAISDNDGETWKLADNRSILLTGGTWQRIKYIDGQFMIISYNGYISYSPNGISWTKPVSAMDSVGYMWEDVIKVADDLQAIAQLGYVNTATKSLALVSGQMGFQYHKDLKVYPFYISENDFILCGFSPINTEFIRIKDSKIVAYYPYGALESYVTNYDVSFTQQNNYAIIGTEGKTFILKMTLNPNGVDFVPDLSTWDFTAGWYAPYGTKTKTVGTTQIPGLEFNHDTKGFQPYIYTASDGSSTTYSYIDTNLADNAANRLNLTNGIPAGSIVTFPNNGAFFRVEGITSVSSTLKLYGSLLTAVADSSAKDQQVSVEYGYISLQPQGLIPEYSWPRPTKFLFSEQRLWTGGWIIDDDVQYSLVIGSQIARYTDLKNDYNQANEAITLDIFTKYKEQILHLVDYNGLKIFTNSHEYAFQNGGAVKQSANGSLASCEPIVFESLCLYCDKTGNQIRAMQYQFQNNIYDSNIINQIAPHDLIWNPVCMATYEDKTNSTGKYLFVVNANSANNPKMAVCNFVPANQANIWSRWSMQKTVVGSEVVSLIHSVVNTKEYPIFMLVTKEYTTDDATLTTFVKPAYIDFNTDADMIGNVVNNRYIIDSYTYVNYDNIEATDYITLPNVVVNVYSNGILQWSDTTDANGYLTKDTSELTNVTVGLPINATVRSHPIDVGGKTKSEKKRIGKAQMSVHETEPGAITLNGKTGYMNPEHDHICFYGVSGMKDELKYIITNNNGAMFHLESLLMNIEYGTLDS